MRNSRDPFNIFRIRDHTLDHTHAIELRMKLRAVNRPTLETIRLLRHAILRCQQHRTRRQLDDVILMAGLAEKCYRQLPEEPVGAPGVGKSQFDRADFRMRQVVHTSATHRPGHRLKSPARRKGRSSEPMNLAHCVERSHQPCPFAGNRIVAAPTQKYEICLQKTLSGRRSSEQIEHINCRRIAFERSRETAHLLRPHRVIRIPRLQQKVTELPHAIHPQQIRLRTGGHRGREEESAFQLCDLCGLLLKLDRYSPAP